MVSVADIEYLLIKNQKLEEEQKKVLDRCMLLEIELSRIQAMLDLLDHNETHEM